MDLLSGIVSTIASLGAEQWRRSSEVGFLRDALRERLHREVRLNLELYEILSEEEQLPRFDELMSADAFLEVCSLNLPLSRILGSDPLPTEVRDLLLQKGAATPNGNFVNWSQNIQCEIELIERVWHRMRVLRIRGRIDGSLGNLEYLRHLLRALDASLRLQRAKDAKKGKS